MSGRIVLPSKGELAALAVQDWCRKHGFTVPVAEHKFHPKRKWRFDLCWPAPDLVAIEFQGGAWVHGAHTRGKHFESDCAKFSEAAVLGWRLLLCTYEQFEAGWLYSWIERLWPA